MSIRKYFNEDNLLLILSILSGTFVGLLITAVCLHNHWSVFGIHVDIFIAPVVAGFVETIVSNYTRKKSSGAISSILLFFITNGIGWLFPSTPIKFNIFTVGGIILMLQAAFPLLINYILIAIFLAFTYVMGVMGSVLVRFLNKNQNTPTVLSNLEETEKLGVYIFNSKPLVPIMEYHCLVFSEDVIDFENKAFSERIEYVRSKEDDKLRLKHNDYTVAREYILHYLGEEALKVNANAVIDVQFEYANYNQQTPPDVLIAAYGTAVTIDEKYLEKLGGGDV